MRDEDFNELEDIQEEQKLIETVYRKKDPRISKPQIMQKSNRYRGLEFRRKEILSQIHAEREVRHTPKYISPKKYVPPTNPRPWDLSYWKI